MYAAKTVGGTGAFDDRQKKPAGTQARKAMGIDRDVPVRAGAERSRRRIWILIRPPS